MSNLTIDDWDADDDDIDSWDGEPTECELCGAQAWNDCQCDACGAQGCDRCIRHSMDDCIGYLCQACAGDLDQGGKAAQNVMSMRFGGMTE